MSKCAWEFQHHGAAVIAFAPIEIKVNAALASSWSSPRWTRGTAFKLPVFQIQQKIAKGEAATVEFTAGYAQGRFPYNALTSAVWGITR